MNNTLDMEQYKALARQAAAEGCVLLENKNETLPLRKGDRVAVFGRMAFHYYKSGLGSGGLVNARYVVGILDALKKEKDIVLDETLLSVYEDWIKEHPYDEGEGWGKVPWSQVEMPLSDDVLAAAADNDVALVVIGRTAGEDQDNTASAGSYLLTDTETELIAKVSRTFPRTAVLLNTGNIIDMKWVKACDPAAVLYVWQGGQEGGNGVCDVLCGRVSPSGKLTDTIAEDIADYPSTAHFGDAKRNEYQEDIFVGYRYFETFAKEKVRYPFGYGLSYTTFAIDAKAADAGENIRVEVSVQNTGAASGKEVVQVYVHAPLGALNAPERVLCGFAKTKELAPGESERLVLTIPKRVYASYDDSGVTGHRDCFVLTEGTYGFYVGTDVRSAVLAGSCTEPFTVVEQLTEVCAPQKPFARMQRAADGKLCYADTPKRMHTPYDRVESPKELPYTGDNGYKLADVYDEKVTMDAFLAQLTDDDLMALFHGEGMCSPKVTPGTAAAFGGVTERLAAFGIPAACASDGPSGMRLDCGTCAFSLPNGTLLGATFNLQLVEQLYAMTGRELRRNRVDTLLGPGMNIHRNPLNGRNFEYFSEDPLLTGKMGAAQLRGLNIVGSTGTIKHFAGNNQEKERRQADSVISVRALREIYLRGFEIAVKEGPARSVMTTYGPVNGLWTAGSFELNTIVLRQEWGFSGIVMTDWWAEGNHEGEPSSPRTHAVMAAAQNDVFMVTPDAADQTADDIAAALAGGQLTRGQLQRNAANILRFILQSPAMLYEMDRISDEERAECSRREDGDVDLSSMRSCPMQENGDTVLSGTGWDTKKGASVLLDTTVKDGDYTLILTVRSELGTLAQLPVSVYVDNQFKGTLSFRGTDGETAEQTLPLGGLFAGSHHYLKLYFGASGLAVEQLRLRCEKAQNGSL